MKILYKIFIFVLIIRLVPIIISSMGIFPNTALEGLGYSFTATSDPYDLILKVISLGNSNFVLIPDVPLVGDITFVFTYASIIGILLLVAIWKPAMVPTVVAGMSAIIIIPFIVDAGYLFINGAMTYGSTPLLLMMSSIIIGFVVLAIITIWEGAAQSQDVSD